MKTILIVGLGNPGKEYAKTRHNAGFMFIDHFFEKYRDEFDFSGWEEKKKLKSSISAGKSGEKKIILAKPNAFMNLSGEAVTAAVKYFKIKLSDLIIVHDEIDLPLGTFKISADSSSAGHKGVQNIIDMLGTKNFTRLRIGVDNRKKPASAPADAEALAGKKAMAGEEKIPTEKYVLGKFTAGEEKSLKETIKKSCEELISCLKSQCQNPNVK